MSTSWQLSLGWLAEPFALVAAGLLGNLTVFFSQSHIEEWALSKTCNALGMLPGIPATQYWKSPNCPKLTVTLYQFPILDKFDECIDAHGL
jgi:hypothetical protein